MSTYETAIPNSASYLQAQAMAQQAYAMAMAQIAQARSGTLRGAGYLDNGGKGKLEIDPNNFFGGIQSLFRTHAQDMAAQNLNYAGRGIQGGVRAGAQYNQQMHAGGETSHFGQALDQQMNQYAGQEQSAAMTRDNALWQAQQAALQEALMQQLFNQGVVTSGTGGAAVAAGAGVPQNPYYPDPNLTGNSTPDPSIPWWLLK